MRVPSIEPTASRSKRLTSDSVKKPCAMVVPYGESRRARSASTWIHCRSPVTSANCVIASCVISRHGDTISLPTRSASATIENRSSPATARHKRIAIRVDDGIGDPPARRDGIDGRRDCRSVCTVASAAAGIRRGNRRQRVLRGVLQPIGGVGGKDLRDVGRHGRMRAAARMRSCRREGSRSRARRPRWPCRPGGRTTSCSLPRPLPYFCDARPNSESVRCFARASSVPSAPSIATPRPRRCRPPAPDSSPAGCR